MSKLSILYNVISKLKKNDVNNANFNMSVIEDQNTILNFEGNMNKGEQGLTTDYQVSVNKDDMQFSFQAKASHGQQYKMGFYRHREGLHCQGRHHKFGKKHGIKKFLCFIKLLDLMQIENNDNNSKNMLIEINQNNMPEIKELLTQIKNRHERCTEQSEQIINYSEQQSKHCKVIYDLMNDYNDLKSVNINALIDEENSLKELKLTIIMSNKDNKQLSVNALATVN